MGRKLLFFPGILFPYLDLLLALSWGKIPSSTEGSHIVKTEWCPENQMAEFTDFQIRSQIVILRSSFLIYRFHDLL